MATDRASGSSLRRAGTRAAPALVAVGFDVEPLVCGQADRDQAENARMASRLVATSTPSEAPRDQPVSTTGASRQPQQRAGAHR